MSDLPAVPNYGAPFASLPNPSQALASGIGLADHANQQIVANQQMQMAMAQRAQANALMSKINSPDGTAADRMRLVTLLNPEQAKTMENTFENMDKNKQQQIVLQGGKVLSAAMSGHPDIAVDLIRQGADAKRAAGDEAGAAFDEKLAQSAEADPTFIENYYSHVLPFIPNGGKEAVDSILAQTASPHENDLRDAQAAQAWAEALRNKTQATNVPEQLVPKLNDVIDKSQAAIETAYRYNGLASQYETILKNAPSGFAGKTLGEARKIAGVQNFMDRAYTEWQNLKTTGTLAILPPGSASDRDIEIARGAFPDDNTSPPVLASFLRGMAKLKTYEADKNAALGQWMSQNKGSQGNAMGDFEVNGEPVKAGTNFASWAKNNLTFHLPLSDDKAASGPGSTPTAAPLTLTLSDGSTVGPFKDQKSFDAAKADAMSSGLIKQ